jgi:uncharacterized protein involved in exopolysaccharide biosynthesis
MTAQTSDVYSDNLRPQDSEEIDLRRYILVLLSWWREIVLISILVAAITGFTISLLNYNKTPEYTASTDILIARLLSNIELDDRVETSIGSPADANGWRTSLLALAKSSVVANAVIEDLGDELPTDFQSPGDLLDSIEATVPLSPDERSASNIIRISATTTTPELSARIANSWGLHLVDHINGLYGEVPETTIASVTAERDSALSTYQKAEKDYEDFVANNHIDGLTRQIQEKTTLRNEIMVNYTHMLTSVVSSEYDAQLNLYNALTKAPVDHAVALLDTQSRGNVMSLQTLYDLRASALAQLSQARVMESSLVDGGEAAAKSNVTALQMLKLAAFSTLNNQGSTSVSNITISNALPNIEMTLDEQLTDVRSLVSSLEGYVDQLEQEIKQLASSTMIGADLAQIGGVNNGLATSLPVSGTTPAQSISNAYQEFLRPSGILDQTPVDISSAISDTHEQLLAQLESDIRTLQAAVSAETALQQQLVHQRDLAWTTFDTVGNKLQELILLRSSANTEVRVGNPALIPNSPEPTMSPLMPTVVLGLAGFFLAVVLALLVDSLGGGPFFARRTA